ncbi:MAG: hypothetical protein ABJN35_11670 [Erythrobacter sp.]
MALLLLITVGVTAGWFASIIARTEAIGDIMRQIAAALVASIAVGLFLNSGTVLGGLSLIALGSACLAAIAALIAYHAIAARKTDSADI